LNFAFENNDEPLYSKNDFEQRWLYVIKINEYDVTREFGLLYSVNEILNGDEIKMIFINPSLYSHFLILYSILLQNCKNCVGKNYV